MTKFYRIKDTEIRKVAEVNEDGSVKVIALIGKIGELMEKGIISDVDGTLHDVRDRWLVVPKVDADEEREDLTFNTLEDAKASFR